MANIPGLLEKYKKIEGERFFQDVILDEEYKLAFPEKADVIIDVGALAGEFGAYMYDKAQVIYALEPHQGHYKELTTNIKEFGLSKFRPFNLALTDYNGEGTLVWGPRGGHKLVLGGGSDKTQKVKVKTLAQFMKDQKIDEVDILKIDIENGEDQVFTSSDFKDVARKIKFMIGEHAGVVVSDALRANGFYFCDTPRGWFARREDA